MRPTRSLLTGLLVAAVLATSGSSGAAAQDSGDVLSGVVRVVVVDEPPGGGDGLVTRAVADVGDRLLDLPPAVSDGVSDGDLLTVTARRGASAVTGVRSVRPAPAPDPRSGPAPTAGGTTAGGTARVAAVPGAAGPHSLTVLPVYWSVPDDQAPRAALTALAAETAQYWSQQSGGRIAVSTEVRDWIKIPDPGSCSSSALANAALAAHEVDLPQSDADHVMVYFPHRSDCGGWAGLGEVGGSMIWDNGYPLPDVVAHEFGHNLGLGHANTATCSAGGSRATLSSACTLAEYRDYADVMGIAMDTASGNLNSALADSLGLVQSVTAAPGARTSVDLAPLSRTDAVRALRIKVPSGWVYLDYRPATGRDVRMPRWAGVQVHHLPDADVPASRLLDGQPGTSQAFSSAALPVGTPWSVPDAGVTVTVTAMTSGSAHVDVVPAGTGTLPASPVITAPANRAVVSSSATVSWRVPARVASIGVFVDGQQVATATTTALTGTVRITGLAGGTHTLGLRSLDSAGTASSGTATITVAADVTPPTVPGGLALSSAQLLSWRGSSDSTAGLGGYLVSMDGGSPTRVGAASIAARTPVGRHTWWVAAVDRVGNVSPAAGLVVVRASTSAKARATTVRLTSTRPTTAGQRTIVTGRTVGASHPV